MQSQHTTARDMVTVTLVLFALALPFLPLAWDGAARMQVHFRTSEMPKPRVFTAETSSSTCQIMAAALTYENPETGEYTHVACTEQPAP